MVVRVAILRSNDVFFDEVSNPVFPWTFFPELNPIQLR